MLFLEKSWLIHIKRDWSVTEFSVELSYLDRAHQDRMGIMHWRHSQGAMLRA